MITGLLMHAVGKGNSLLFRIPLMGEKVVRTQGRVLANLAFHAPLIGGKRCKTLGEVKEEWLKFLARSGIYPTITREDDQEFEFTLDACPWGFQGPDDVGVCDACMDLDRTYVKLLGGELEVRESIPSGGACCTSVVRKT